MFIGPEPHLIYSPVMCNFKGLWPYVWPQNSTKTSTCDGLVIISCIEDISLCAWVSWTQRLLGKLIQDQS
jgi:hypothetical protein